MKSGKLIVTHSSMVGCDGLQSRKLLERKFGKINELLDDYGEKMKVPFRRCGVPLTQDGKEKIINYLNRLSVNADGLRDFSSIQKELYNYLITCVGENQIMPQKWMMNKMVDESWLTELFNEYKHQIPTSLQQLIKVDDEKIFGGFNEWESCCIISFLNHLIHMEVCEHPQDVAKFAYELAKRIDVKMPTKWNNMIELEYFYQLLQQHNHQLHVKLQRLWKMGNNSHVAMVFSEKQEEEIWQHLIRRSGLKKTKDFQLQRLIYKFAINNEYSVPTFWQHQLSAPQEFVENFLHRKGETLESFIEKCDIILREIRAGRKDNIENFYNELKLNGINKYQQQDERINSIIIEETNKADDSGIFDLSSERKLMASCSICGYIANDGNNLVDHIRVRHRRVKVYICPICEDLEGFGNFFTLSFTLLKKHFIERNHNLKKLYEHATKYSCLKCPFTCDKMGEMRKHMNMTHQHQHPFTCNKCNKYACENEQQLRIHININHSQIYQYNGKMRRRKIIYCGICGHKTLSMVRMKRHMNLIHKEDSKITG